MAHEITFRQDATAEAAFAHQPPWWDPNFPVLDHNMTSAEALIAAQLDWEVISRSLIYFDSNRKEVETTARALVRLDDSGHDRVLGIVTDDYHILQNRQAFEMLDILHGEGGLQFLSAGSLREGKQVFMMGEFPDSITLKNSIHKKHLACINDHTGTAKVKILACDTRIVCANTVSAGISESENDGVCASFRHSGNIQEKVKEVRDLLMGIDNQFEHWYHQYAILMEKPCHELEFNTYVSNLFPAPIYNIDQPIQLQDRMLERYAAKKSQLIDNFFAFRPIETGYTWYAGFNAVTEHIDHQLTYRTAGSRFHNVLLNHGASVKRHALKLALDMAKR